MTARLPKAGGGGGGAVPRRKNWRAQRHRRSRPNDGTIWHGGTNGRVHLTYDSSGVQCRGVRVMLHIFNGGTVDHEKRGYAATTMTPLDATAAAAAAAFVIVP